MNRKALIVCVLISGLLIFNIPLHRAERSRGYLTVTDARGEKVVFDSAPDRIISFMASNTEILFYLGVGDRVVGVDDYSDHPPEVNDLPQLGGAYSVDYDMIVNLSADVVVITKANLNMVDPLNNYNQKVLVTNSDTLDNIYEDMRILGKMCGMEEEAEDKVSYLKKEMKQATENTEDLPYKDRPDLLFITSSYQGIWTAGNDTFQDTLITRAGFDNIAGDKSGWTTIEEEEIINDDPDVIIAVNSTREYVLEAIEKDTWSSITAVEENNIYFIDDDIISRPGPRMIDAENRLVDINDDLIDLEDDRSDDESVPAPACSLIIFTLIITTIIYRKKR